MNKLKLSLKLSLLTLLIFLLGCSNNVTKDEALKQAKPIITSILEYKKENNKYPNSLMEIKNFPYKINQLASIGEYYFPGMNDLTLYAGGYETGLSPESGYIYRISISFDESRWSNAVTSIFVGFRKDDSYKISYTIMPPAFKQ